MKKRLCRIMAFTLWGVLAICVPARGASSIRYALIVGNNHANSPELPLKDLQHAEAEARKLGNLLVQFGNFDPERIIVLTGMGRQEVLEAASRLAELHQRDREELGKLPTLFAFFYTGHGLSGRLLTRDEPITGVDLGAVFQQMDATLSVGFFDACFSESLGLLQGKGAVATPGFNPFTELPREVLRSEGKIWFVSSRPEEQSFEDERVGGLFTFYFQEAFTRAEPDGIAITLDEMWEYARRNTESHAARYGQSQTPVKIVHSLKTRGPLYFSFPSERTARLRFDPQVEGTFLVQYRQGALVEKVVKHKGHPLEVPLYEGEVLLSRAGAGKGERLPSQKLVLEEGSTVQVRASGAATGIPVAFGYDQIPIHGKGELEGLVITEQRKRTTLGVSLAYGLSPAPESVLSGLHRVQAGTVMAHGPISVSLDLFYGWNGAEYADWSYGLHETGLRVLAGIGFDMGAWRFDLEGGAEPRLQRVEYTDDTEIDVDHFALWLGGGARILWTLPVEPGLTLQLRAGLGTLRSRAIAAGDPESYWSMTGYAELGLCLPVWK